MRMSSEAVESSWLIEAREAQAAEFENLVKRRLDVGFRPEWTTKMTLILAPAVGPDASSTTVRQAAHDRDWLSVGRQCPPSVAGMASHL